MCVCVCVSVYIPSNKLHSRTLKIVTYQVETYYYNVIKFDSLISTLFHMSL